MTDTSIQSLLPQREQFLRFLQHRVESPAAAEDILQNAYVRAMQHGPELRDEGSAVAWFYRILRNAVIDHYRRRSAEDRALERWARDLATTQPDPQTENIVCACIDDAMLTLKPSYREALRAVDLAGQTAQTFADCAGITPGNATVRVHRARLALKKKLIQICGTCSAHGCVDCSCRKA